MYNGNCSEISIIIYNYLNNQDIHNMKKTHPFYNVYIMICVKYEKILYIKDIIKQYVKDNDLFKYNIQKYIETNMKKFIREINYLECDTNLYIEEKKNIYIEHIEEKKYCFINNEYNYLILKLKEIFASNKVKIKGYLKYPKLFEYVMNLCNLKYKIINIHIDKKRISNNSINKKYNKDTSYTEYELINILL
jgi:hypothetical protein